MAAFLKSKGITHIKNTSGELVDIDTINTNKIGLYFSAHWCPPCRTFTPVLSETYQGIIDKAKTNELFIIFISSDNNEDDFNHYHKSMTFAALPFQEREIARELAREFEVKGIPALIILNSDGSVSNTKGRTIVTECNGDVDLLLSKI